MMKQLVRGVTTTMCLFGMSIGAATASAEPECEHGDYSNNITSGTTYCAVTAFGSSYAYRISLKARQLNGGYQDLEVTRVGRIPGSLDTYDCDFDNASVEVSATTEDNGVFESRTEPLNLQCNQPVTLMEDEGSVFRDAQCKVIFGCQGE